MNKVSLLLNQLSKIEPEFKVLKKQNDEATFVIEPLLPGYGVTLGNALRRVLLSSLEGSSVVAVKIKGASHEFTTIPGVKEDVIEIILNLKNLIIKFHSEGSLSLELKAKGPKTVKASDIKVPSDIEIVNTDLLIASLDSKAELEMEIFVEKGVGYLPTEERRGQKLPIGTIAVDAIFSPIRKVSFEIENTRVGEMTNLDKLILDIKTNGTISAEEALKEASSILIEQFSIFVTPKKVIKKVSDDLEKKVKPEKIMVEELDLSPRTANVLLKSKIKTVKEILSLDSDGLKTLKGLGKTTLDEIDQKLSELGLSLPKEEKKEIKKAK